MNVLGIPFKDTGYFSELICDYLEEKEALRPFYNRFPNLPNFKDQILEKQGSFPQENRRILVKALQNQHKNDAVSSSTKANIVSLSEPNTFTVVTGHQLNLFTGPLYFLYKIISTINLTKTLKKTYPQYHFVPVYWMATEDHDFEEINFFNFKQTKIQWNRDASGAVGRFKTKGLDAVLNVFEAALGDSDNANVLKALFASAYLEHSTLTEATRYLVNALFGEDGLVIIDGDDVALKTLLSPFVKKELEDHTPFKEVSKTSTALQAVSSTYKIQVNPREINYFYLKDGLRARIVAKEDLFLVNDTDISFSKEALLEELQQHPERFSPNVITRPLYQEVILPNLCYIGGGGELAYWLELKSSFKAMNVTFPMLLLRNSVLVVQGKQQKKLNKLGVAIQDLFLKQTLFINKRIRAVSNIDIDFTDQKKTLEEQFKALYVLAEQTDVSFLGAVKAQEVKQIKGLNALEKRLLKAQKRKLKDEVIRMVALQNELFPNTSLQERNTNFSDLYLEFGADLIPNLKDELDPLGGQFTVITL